MTRLEMNMRPRDAADLLLALVALQVDMNGWEASWDVRGVRLTHGRHSLVIGVGADVATYVRSG
jgi:hypothetical protein